MIGVDLEGHEKAYDLIELQKAKLVNDQLGPNALVAMADDDNTSAFIYDRNIKDQTLTFAREDDKIIDLETKSTWTHLGQWYFRKAERHSAYTDTKLSAVYQGLDYIPS